MADDNRFRDDRNRQQGYGQPQFGQDQLGPGQFSQGAYGQENRSQGMQNQRQPSQGDYGYGQPQGQQQGHNQYGQAGGYSQSFGGGQQGQFGPQHQYGQDYWQGGQSQGQQQQHGQYQGFAQNQQSPYQQQRGYAGDYSRAYGRGDQQQPTGFHGQSQGAPSYTGQTGTGYGYSAGGGYQGGFQGERSDQGGDSPSLWDKAKSLFTGDDHGQQGSHRGRGPKSYSRSDERIRDDVNDRLTDDPFLDATHIEVMAEGGEVTLSGTVSSRADKRRAEDLADNVSGVKHVQNNLRVESAASLGSSGGADRLSGLNSEGRIKQD